MFLHRSSFRTTAFQCISGALMLASALSATGCATDEELDEELPPIERFDTAGTVGYYANNPICPSNTGVVRALSRQLVEEVNCIAPGSMRDISALNVSLGPNAFPYLQASAADALSRAIAQKGETLSINSGLRTLAQQYLLYYWQDDCADISVAAFPGGSNHNGATAIDIPFPYYWRSTLEANGWRWYGPGDEPHFDFVGGGTSDFRSRSTLAFQRLWNRNNPNDRIAEDGSFGKGTELRLRKSPVNGFPIGATCTDPGAEESFDPIEVYWARQTDGSYKLHALPFSNVQRVEYLVDNIKIGDSDRTKGSNFPATYAFSQEKNERAFEIKGFDASNKQVARGVGLIDVTQGVGVFIRQLGEGHYDIGIERAPAAVGYIEVKVDEQFLLTNELNSTSRGSVEGDVHKVRYRFGTLGTRKIAITTYNPDGTVRGTLRREFNFR